MAAYGYPGPSDPTAVMGRRIGAFFIDAAIAMIVFAMIFVPLATKRTVNETLDLPGCHRKSDDASQVECDNRQVVRIGDTVYEANGGATFGLDFAFVFLYFGLLQGVTGATLGKLLTGIRVVDQSGRISGIGRSLLRGLVFAVDGPFTFFLCGLLTSLLTKGHRRLGDMAAGTYVVGATSVGQPVVLPGATPAFAPVPGQPFGAPPVQPFGAPGQPFGAPAGPAGAPPPQWDPTRNAYVQWDPATGRYLTWDPTSQTWQ